MDGVIEQDNIIKEEVDEESYSQHGQEYGMNSSIFFL